MSSHVIENMEFIAQIMWEGNTVYLSFTQRLSLNKLQRIEICDATTQTMRKIKLIICSHTVPVSANGTCEL